MTTEKLFPIFMLLGLVSPFVSIAGAVIFYRRHSNRVGPEHRMSVFGYVVAIIVCGAAAGFFGLTLGIAKACNGSDAGNLCGLWGVFVTGPIFFAAAILLAGLLISSMRQPQS